jgi:hypothetical protein
MLLSACPLPTAVSHVPYAHPGRQRAIDNASWSCYFVVVGCVGVGPSHEHRWVGTRVVEQQAHGVCFEQPPSRAVQPSRSVSIIVAAVSADGAWLPGPPSLATARATRFVLAWSYASLLCWYCCCGERERWKTWMYYTFKCKRLVTCQPTNVTRAWKFWYAHSEPAPS